MLKKYIGDKAFYKMVLLIAVPIALQNGITQFVNMLDNLMVGQIGTEQMSGVSIVNQLTMVFNLCIFGLVSGAGIFTAQYFGKGDHDGVRHTFHLKLMTCTAVAILAILLLSWKMDFFIGLFLHEADSAGSLEATLEYGKQYLRIMFIGLVPYALSQAYSSTLRETGQTMVPMVSGLAAVAVNMMFNYVLIFGKLGLPALGVQGAAIATVISRFAELGILVFWTHRHAVDMPFIIGTYKDMRIPLPVFRSILIKGLPLAVNELFWSTGMTFLTQCYSIRGLDAIASMNIANVIFQVFNTIFVALGSSIAIIIGQLLGAGKMEEAKDTVRKLLFASVISCAFMSLILAVAAPFFPLLYNTTSHVQKLATELIWVNALMMPVIAYLHGAYFTVRAGGKSIITFLFDSGSLWVLQVPLAFVLTRFTGLPLVPIYLAVEATSLIKCAAATFLLKKGVWLHKIVD